MIPAVHDYSCVRERLEREERDRLSPFAARSCDSRGRAREETPSPLRTSFQRDRDRIIHSKSFRRLKHKTQVFVATLSDHYRTRLTHTLEVAQIGRTIARALRLNEDLVEAVALGHDLGHPPFGHAGEEALEEVFPEGFHHNEQSLRVIDRIENDGRGLNLTWEVRDGVLHHSKLRESIAAVGYGLASTFEGQVVKLADSVAYLNHDVDDAARAGIISVSDLPGESLRVLGRSHSERINTLVCDVVANNWEIAIAGPDVSGQSAPGPVCFSPDVLKVADVLREFLFRNVYTHPSFEEDRSKCRALLLSLYDHFRAHVEELPAEFVQMLESDSPERVVCDYIACMTDRYAFEVFYRLHLPTRWYL